MSEFAKKRRQ